MKSGLARIGLVTAVVLRIAAVFFGWIPDYPLGNTVASLVLYAAAGWCSGWIVGWALSGFAANGKRH